MKQSQVSPAGRDDLPSTPLKVALVGDFPMHPLRFGGGVVTSTWHLIEGLLQLGSVEVHVVTTSTALRDRLVFSSEAVDYHYLPGQKRLNTLTMYRLTRRRILDEIDAIRPDVVHAQTTTLYGPICLDSGYPAVVSVHGIISEELAHASGWGERLRGRVHALSQKRTVARADHLIQPTTYPQHRLGASTNARWHDTGNAISDRFFSVERHPRPDTVLYVGAVMRRKRLVDLVEALALLARQGTALQLRVAGPEVETSYATEVRHVIAAHGLEERVSLLGLLDQAQLEGELAGCTTLVLPSGQETSPMVIAEAMAAGVPVIATDVGGVTSLLTDGVTGLVIPPGEPKLLAEAIERLIEVPDLGLRLATAARTEADHRFRSVEVAARILDVYRLAVRGNT